MSGNGQNNARIGDMWVGTCKCHPSPIPMSGIIIAGESSVLAQGSPKARQGDMVIGLCGHTGTISSATSLTVVGKKQDARMSDRVSGCFSGVIVTGSSTVRTA
ncbi:hypothetical protein [Pseudoalteromonas citrea]|nr:hypothetical protein [Pseudoalteromonas citrea]